MPLVPPSAVRRKSGREMAIESRAAAEAQTTTGELGFVRRQLEESKRLRGALAPSAEPTVAELQEEIAALRAEVAALKDTPHARGETRGIDAPSWKRAVWSWRARVQAWAAMRSHVAFE